MIDTGTDCVCNPENLVPEDHNLNISKRASVLNGHNGNSLMVVFVSKMNLIYNDTKFSGDIYIVSGLVAIY